MGYVYQEFPKALYRKGVYSAVADEAAEAAARAEGWTDYITDRDGAKPAAVVPAVVVAESYAPAVVSSEVEPAAPVEVAPIKRKPGRPAKAKP